MSITLGLHIGHDGGAALVRDNEVLVACSEERLTRYKYANGWWNALRYCLDSANLHLSDIDLVVLSNAGESLPAEYDAGLGRWSSLPLTTCVVDHHLSHAVCAYSLSGLRKALVFVGDAGGNDDMTESAYVFEGDHFERISKSRSNRERCKGLGTTYEAFTNFLGFGDQESGKTMALAAYGDPDYWKIDIFDVKPDGTIASDLRAPHFWGVTEWASRQNIDIGAEFPDSTSEKAKNVAAFIQRCFEESLTRSLELLAEQSGIRSIVLSGGIGLNCVANSKLRAYRTDMDMYYSPVCSDTGLPLGNALYGQWLLNKQIPSLKGQSLLLGKTYNDTDILRALQRNPDTVPPSNMRLGELVFYKSSAPAIEAAEMLATGRIVAWWQGRSELGPRALGGRSILANPRTPEIRDQMNDRIKEREWFRPFGPSILSEDIAGYVEMSRLYPYMIEAPRVSKEGQEALGDCVHINRTARIQTVDSTEQLEYALLLKKIKQLTGHAVVLNTSFNIQEPIVETPGDAIATFLRSKLDALVLGEYICHRR